MSDFIKANASKRIDHLSGSKDDSNIPFFGEKIEYLKDGSEVKYDSVSAVDLFEVLQLQSGWSTACNVMDRLLPKKRSKSGGPERVNSSIFRPGSIREITKEELFERISSPSRRPKGSANKIVKDKESFGKSRSSSHHSLRKARKQLKEDDFYIFPDSGHLPNENCKPTSKVTTENYMEGAIKRERYSDGEGPKFENDLIEKPSRKTYNDTIELMRNSDTSIQIGRLPDISDKCDSPNHHTVNKLKKTLSLEHLDDHMNENPDPAKHPLTVTESTLRKPSNYKKEVTQNEKKSQKDDSIKNKVPPCSIDVTKELKELKSMVSMKQKKPLRLDYLDNIPDLGLSHKLDDSTFKIPLDNNEEQKDQSEISSYGEVKKYEFFEIKNSPRRPYDPIEVMKNSDITIQKGKVPDIFDKRESPNYHNVNKLKKPLSSKHLDDCMNEVPPPVKHPYNVTELTLMKPSKSYKKEEIQNEKDWNLSSKKSDKDVSIKRSIDETKELVNRKASMKLRKPLSLDYLVNIPDLGLSHKLDDSTLKIPIDNKEEEKVQSKISSYDDGKKYEFFEIKISPRRPKRKTNRKRKIDEILDPKKLPLKTGGKHMDGVVKKCETNDPIAVKNFSRKSKDVTCNAKEKKNFVGQKSKDDSPKVLLSKTTSDVRLATAMKRATIIPAPKKELITSFNLNEYVFPKQEDLNRMNMNLHRCGLPSMDANYVKEMRTRSSLLINYAEELRNKFKQRHVENEKYWQKRSEQEPHLVSYMDSGPNLSAPTNCPTIYIGGIIFLIIFLALALLFIAFIFYAPEPPTFWERILIMFKKFVFEVLFGYFFG